MSNGKNGKRETSPAKDKDARELIHMFGGLTSTSHGYNDPNAMSAYMEHLYDLPAIATPPRHVGGPLLFPPSPITTQHQVYDPGMFGAAEMPLGAREQALGSSHRTLTYSPIKIPTFILPKDLKKAKSKSSSGKSKSSDKSKSSKSSKTRSVTKIIKTATKKRVRTQVSGAQKYRTEEQRKYRAANKEKLAIIRKRYTDKTPGKTAARRKLQRKK